MAASRSQFEFECVEVRADSWGRAADSIVRRLKQAHVRRGQVVSIDAHNNGPDEMAIFSAHFSRQYPDQGELLIEYTEQNTTEAWATMYERAATHLNTTFDDVISITSSCNEGGRGVTYVFKYRTLQKCQACGVELCCSEASFCCRCGARFESPIRRDVTWVESRGGSWSEAAEGIVQRLKEMGVERGQVLGIDAHLNDREQEPIFSAFVDRAAPGRGPINIVYLEQLDKTYGWRDFYEIQCAQAAVNSRVVGDVMSMTSSVTATGTSVAFVFMDWTKGPPPGPDLELEVLETRASSWDDAATEIIARLKSAGVRRGQIVSIDAHSNGPHEAGGFFSAHFSRERADGGPLDIEFERQATAEHGWTASYESAVEGLSAPADMISITSSCSLAGGKVTYVFRYVPAQARAPGRNVVWVQAHGQSWNAAADSIVEQILQRGAQKGQVLGIDAHNDGFNARPTFSAFLDLDAPGRGPVDLSYLSQVEKQYSWSAFYNVAHVQAAALCSSPEDVISITGSISSWDSSVAFVFADFSAPRLVLTVRAHGAEPERPVACTSLDGREVATVRLEAGSSVGALRAAIAAQVGQPVRLVLPDGRLLAEALDQRACEEALA